MGRPALPKENYNKLEAEIKDLVEELWEEQVASFLNDLHEELKSTGDVVNVRRKLAGFKKFCVGG